MGEEMFSLNQKTAVITGAADGIDHVEHGFTNVQTMPSEAWGARYPICVRDHELRTDSGGPGKFRGGLGIKRSFEILHGPARSCHRHDRLLSSPWGYNGGMPGARWNCYIERANGTVEKLHSKQVIELQTGDVYVRETGGGGGRGDPLERDPQSVVEDVLDRKVSPRSAREDYGVVLLENNFEFDAQVTIALRSELANERGPINWMFDHGEDGRR